MPRFYLTLSSLLLVAHALLASAQSLPDFSSSTTCPQGSLCRNLTLTGYAFETAQHATNVATSPFYVVPSNFSRKLAPGSLLRVERATNLANYTVPAGLTMSRIMFATTDLNGTVIPASGYVLWPAVAPAGRGGFDMVAWAHGTSGIFPACAPSNYRALQYHFMVPFALAFQGVAVVAPDYAGLGVGFLPDGTPIPHAYMASPAQANDLANAVIAARAAFPEYLSTKGRFVAMGHSQGGGVAWAFAERQARTPVPGYRGTVTLAPANDVIGTVAAAQAALANGTMQRQLGFQNKVSAGVTAVYPAFADKALTDLARDRLRNVLAKTQGCLPTDILTFADVPLNETAKPGWTDDATALEFQNRTRTGRKRFAGPMLVLAGDIDAGVPYAFVEAAFESACKTDGGDDLEMVTFVGADHFPLIQNSQSLWMDWIKARLADGGSGGVGARSGKVKCKRRTVAAFRGDFNTKSTLPNWLVSWVDIATSGWQLSL